MELNCFVKSFVYLSKRMSRMTFLYSLNPKDVRKVDGYIRLIDYEAQMTSAGLSNLQNPPLEYLKQVSVDHHLEYSGLESDPLDVTMEDMYPCMVAMCGSGNAFLKVCNHALELTDTQIKKLAVSYYPASTVVTLTL